MVKAKINSGLLLLRGAFFSVAISLTLGIGVILLAQQQKLEAEQAVEREMRAQISAIARFNSIAEHRSLIDKYHARFDRLYQSGIVDNENRLDWIEALQEVVSHLQIPAPKFSITKQASYPAPEYTVGQFTTRYSAMSLHFELAHELDLLRFFSMLQKKTTGHFEIATCALHRTAYPSLMSKTARNTKADCTLDWLTIRRANGKKIEVLL